MSFEIVTSENDSNMSLAEESDSFILISRVVDHRRYTFTFRIYEVLRKKNINENICLSPLSLLILLALTYTGASGNTATELGSLLKLPGNKKRFLYGYAALLEGIKDPVLNVATAMFIEDSFTVKKKFNNQSLKYFKAEAINVCFHRDAKESATIINNWVETQTKNKIKNFIPVESLSSSTLMILINAVHFKANWKYPFPYELTQKEPFYLSKTTTLDTDMMHMRGEFRCLNHLGLNAKILELPYEGDTFSMLIVLPDEIDGLKVIEEQLKNANINYIFNEMRESTVNVSLPKFEMCQTLHLNDTLKYLGVVDMFDMHEAEFSNISEKKIYVSDVLQKTFIKVDEKGTEAAAATAAKIVLLCSQCPETVFEFTADHPFIFIISKRIKGEFLFIFIGRYYGK